MEFTIDTINHLATALWPGTWNMLWQSSLLITVIFVMDLLLARKIRAAVRYALWLVVLVKLLLPPALALPTGAAWWLFPAKPVAAAPMIKHYTVSYDNTPIGFAPATIPLPSPPTPRLTLASQLMLFGGLVCLGLLVWLAFRWYQVTRVVARAVDSNELNELLEPVRLQTGWRTSVRLKIVEDRMSPALCGLFRPVILLPRTLAAQLSPAQLRMVLLHELFHLRRYDAWINFAQTLLQILYWWHPLLWLANARIRHVREQAVDDAVRLALNAEADDYAPTLFEVAKLTLRRPLIHLGLIGIMESRSALRHRIERLVNFPAPRKAGLTFASLCGVVVFSAVALPMGEAPATAAGSLASSSDSSAEQSLTLQVNPAVFLRNAQTHCNKSPLATTNDSSCWLDIMQSEGIDFAPPHAIVFDSDTGNISTRNTPEQLQIFRLVVEQLNRPDGKCELPLRHSPFHRPNVLINAKFYAMPVAEFNNAIKPLPSLSGGVGQTWVGTIPANGVAAFNQAFQSLHLTAFDRPRIEMGHGFEADYFMGSETNSVRFDCRPLVLDKVVELSFRAKITGDPAVDGNLQGGALHEMSGKAVVENNGDIIICTDAANDSGDKHIVAVVNVLILTNNQIPAAASTFPLTLPNPQPAVASHTTGILEDPHFRAVVHALEQRSSTNKLPEPDFTTYSIRHQNQMDQSVLRSMRIDYSPDFWKTNTQKTASNDVAPSQAAQIHIKARFFKLPENFFEGQDQGFWLGAAKAGFGVLTATQARQMLDEIDLQKRYEILAEPEVTTTAGRQTQMRATTLIEVVTNAVFSENPTNHENAITIQTGKIEMGPVLDVVPHLLPDGHTFDLKIIASDTEFVGYADSTNLIPDSFTNSAGETGPLPLILPAVNLSRAIADKSIYDGQTLVLFPLPEQMLFSKLNPEREQRIARHIRAWQASNGNKVMVVLVTAELVDELGHRLYRDDDLPFINEPNFSTHPRSANDQPDSF